MCVYMNERSYIYKYLYFYCVSKNDFVYLWNRTITSQTVLLLLLFFMDLFFMNRLHL
jgi:hypothetical protein